jgi:hypothetical protein
LLVLKVRVLNTNIMHETQARHEGGHRFSWN